MWLEISKTIAEGCEVLLDRSDASFHQYSYFNEGYRAIPFCKPTYYAYYINGVIAAYTAVLSIGFRGARIASISRGPVFFSDCDKTAILRELVLYCFNAGFRMVRFYPKDAASSSDLMNMPNAAKNDAFPIYKTCQTCDMILPYDGGCTENLYKYECRRKLKRSRTLPLKIRETSDIESLRTAYNLFEAVGRKKGFRYRSYDSYCLMLMGGAESEKSVLYTIGDEVKVVAAVFVVRDGCMATHLSSAYMPNALYDRYSPPVLLHHEISMRENARGRKYNISYSGPGSGTYQFKAQYNPTVVVYPDVVSVTCGSAGSRILQVAATAFSHHGKDILRRAIGRLRP